MTDINDSQHRTILRAIARRVMLERGLAPDFSQAALQELDSIKGPASAAGAAKDLRKLLWCSIDNDDSMDLDQLTAAAAMPGGAVKVYIAIADVDSAAPARSALDGHAGQNTTSIYTAAQIFPMLPDKLSTDLTSLKYNSDRLAMTVEMDIAPDGSATASNIYSAVVNNCAKLAYNSTAAWLENRGPMPKEIGMVRGLDQNIKLQYSAAVKMRDLRYQHGALYFDTLETRPVFDGEKITGLEIEKSNSAKSLIEDFMIAANGVTARFLAAKKFPSLRRIVRVPKRWDRIVELAAEKNFKLPQDPDSKTLESFLEKQRISDPAGFYDLSLSVIKLMGPGEYVVEQPGAPAIGHFGLAVKDYTHSTAPNRRYPDLITQRLIKAALAGRACPYSAKEMDELAGHCTEKEDAAKKAERQVSKSAAAMLLESRVGEKFDAVVTGASDKGTWVRITQPPVEGKLVQGAPGLDVGHRLVVQLADVDVQKGFIDFMKAE
jgi:VacB/RNase II family 3'-5' exoribonuclease